MESHDEERQMYRNLEYGNSAGSDNVKDLKVALKRSGAAAAFFFTVPGPKLLWQFGEYGYDVSIDEGGRTSEKPIKWEYLDNPDRKLLHDTYAKLIGLRNKYDVFTKGNFTWQPNGNFKSIHIANADTSVVIIGNFDVESGTINPAFQHTGIWYDFFTGGEITVDNVNDEITLAPGEYHIYSDQKLHTPDVVLNIDSKTIEGAPLSVYPNPTSEYLHIRFEQKTANSWSIFNTMGKEVMQGSNANNGMSVNVSLLPKGIYTFRLGVGKQTLSNF